MHTKPEIQKAKDELIALKNQRVKEIHPKALKSLEKQSVSIRQEGDEYVVLFPFYAEVEILTNAVQITVTKSQYILQNGTLSVKRPQRRFQKPVPVGRGRDSGEEVI